jgi:predicted amidophosphoribosyltransferase
VLDLILPLECGGCGAPSTRWCDACAAELSVAADQPHVGDLVAPLAHALAVGVHRLLVWGMVETPLTIVPAPTRRSAARRRGGDPVTRVALAAVAGHPEISVVRALRMRALARDSVGLSTSARERNVAGRVLLRGNRGKLLGTEVVVVDDVVTTGATARESVRILQTAGTPVAAVLTIAFA